MATNVWRKFDWTKFNQWLRLMGKMIDEWTRLVEDTYNAQNNTSNTFPDADWEIWDPGYSFTIKTPKGRLLKGILLDNNNPWEHFEFTDVKMGWKPIIVSTRMLPEELDLNAKILHNKWNARVLAREYHLWKDKWSENIWIDNERTIDDELDKRYDALKKEYLEMFKKYRQARPDQQWDLAPKVAEAIINYNNLIK